MRYIIPRKTTRNDIRGALLTRNRAVVSRIFADNIFKNIITVCCGRNIFSVNTSTFHLKKISRIIWNTSTSISDRTIDNRNNSYGTLAKTSIISYFCQIERRSVYDFSNSSNDEIFTFWKKKKKVMK